MSKNGFTLIELIIYFGIFAVISVVGVLTLNTALESRTTVRELAETQTQVQRAIEFMVDKVRTSSSISASTTASELWLNRSVAAENPTVFRLSGSSITIQEGTNPQEAITPSTILVTELVFTLFSNPAPATSSVRIRLTAGYNAGGSVSPGTSYTLQTTAMPHQ
jgi:type II secretory pathway component PulJ